MIHYMLHLVFDWIHFESMKWERDYRSHLSGIFWPKIVTPHLVNVCRLWNVNERKETALLALTFSLHLQPHTSVWLAWTVVKIMSSRLKTYLMSLLNNIIVMSECFFCVAGSPVLKTCTGTENVLVCRTTYCSVLNSVPSLPPYVTGRPPDQDRGV